MARYRKKPVEVEAVQWNGDMAPVEEALGRQFPTSNTGSGALEIPTLEGTLVCDLGDYIIRGVQGEFYPCKPDIFEATYEPVED